MEQIEVGEYVRTKKGISRIAEDGRFVEIRENGNRMYYVDTNGTPCTWEFACYIWSKDIDKHSKNIIDLIEVGDYVNGHRVIEIDIDDDDEGTGEKYLWCGDLAIIEDKIKGIVTKEQFASMEYKVGE